MSYDDVTLTGRCPRPSERRPSRPIHDSFRDPDEHSAVPHPPRHRLERRGRRSLRLSPGCRASAPRADRAHAGRQRGDAASADARRPPALCRDARHAADHRRLRHRRRRHAHAALLDADRREPRLSVGRSRGTPAVRRLIRRQPAVRVGCETCRERRRRAAAVHRPDPERALDHRFRRRPLCLRGLARLRPRPVLRHRARRRGSRADRARRAGHAGRLRAAPSAPRAGRRDALCDRRIPRHRAGDSARSGDGRTRRAGGIGSRAQHRAPGARARRARPRRPRP